MTIKVAVLASGNGSNLQAIIDAMEKGSLGIELCCVISDKKDSYSLKRAKKHNIASYYIDKADKTREEFDTEVMTILKQNDVELVVLAGFMRLLSSKFVKAYPNKIMNIHPSLLPEFPGLDGYKDAWEAKVKVSGCTIHFVDEGLDTGPIILQKTFSVKEDDTFESFKERGLKLEHKAYPEAIKLFANGQLKVEGKKVIISN